MKFRTVRLPTKCLPALCLLALCLLALCLLAAVGNAALGQDAGRFGGASDDHLIELEVTVTEQGQPVGGLTADDFEILDDGEPVEITRFDAAENRYALGFRAPRRGTNKLHRLKVSVNRPGMKVRTRTKSYRDRSIDQEMHELTRAALDREEDDNPLGMRLQVRELIPEGDGFVVPIEVRVPFANVELVTREEQIEGRISIYVITRHAQRGLSRPLEMRVPIRYPVDRFKRLRPGQDVVHIAEVVTLAGKQTIAVGVRDDVAAVRSTARLQVKVP